MRTLLVIVLFAAAVWYFGFASPNAIFQDYSAQSGSFLGSGLCADASSQNPFSAGTQEYSGFDWAKNNQESVCIGDSAFKAGCQKQRELVRAYHECAQKNQNIYK